MAVIAQKTDAVFIDFYGTIAAGDRQAVEDTCASIVQTCGIPIPANKFAVLWGERFFRVVAESNHADFRTLIECETTSLRQTLRELGVERDVARFIDQLEAYWRDPPLHPDAVEFLRHVPVPVCCVSNADTHALMQAIDKHGLRFDAVISSESVRSYKPDAKIFEHALDALGVAAHRALHIGDSLHSDIAGASAAGIRAAWIRREDRIHDIGNHDADHIVHSLVDVMPLLG